MPGGIVYGRLPRWLSQCVGAPGLQSAIACWYGILPLRRRVSSFSQSSSASSVASKAAIRSYSVDMILAERSLSPATMPPTTMHEPFG
jgi:hypothetical protein